MSQQTSSACYIHAGEGTSSAMDNEGHNQNSGFLLFVTMDCLEVLIKPRFIGIIFLDCIYVIRGVNIIGVDFSIDITSNCTCINNLVGIRFWFISALWFSSTGDFKSGSMSFLAAHSSAMAYGQQVVTQFHHWWHHWHSYLCWHFHDCHVLM